MTLDFSKTASPTVERPNPRPQPRVVESDVDASRVDDVVSLRERRKRERRPINRRLVALIIAISLLVVIFGGYGLSRSPLLDLDHIDVAGNDRTPTAAILETSQLHTGTAMTDLRLGDASRAIEALPWVDRAKVTRRWPGGVSIRIIERVPVAAVTAADYVVVVDRGGRVLERRVSPEGFTALAPIVIPDAAVEVGQVQPGLSGLLSLATALPDDLRPWVTSISRDDRGAPIIVLRDDALVVFGDLTQISGKYIDLATVLTRVVLKDICRIDVSAVHTPAVMRRPDCTEDAG